MLKLDHHYFIHLLPFVCGMHVYSVSCFKEEVSGKSLAQEGNGVRETPMHDS